MGDRDRAAGSHLSLEKMGHTLFCSRSTGDSARGRCSFQVPRSRTAQRPAQDERWTERLTSPPDSGRSHRPRSSLASSYLGQCSATDPIARCRPF